MGKDGAVFQGVAGAFFEGLFRHFFRARPLLKVPADFSPTGLEAFALVGRNTRTKNQRTAERLAYSFLCDGSCEQSL